LDRQFSDLPVGLRKILLNMIHGFCTHPRGQCTELDPGAALRPQTAHSFDCLDAARPSRIHSNACLRSISRARGSSVRSAARRQSLAWCSHNSTCDDIGRTSFAHLMPARAQGQSRLAFIGVTNAHSSGGVPNRFTVAANFHRGTEVALMLTR